MQKTQCWTHTELSELTHIKLLPFNQTENTGSSQLSSRTLTDKPLSLRPLIKVKNAQVFSSKLSYFTSQRDIFSGGKKKMQLCPFFFFFKRTVRKGDLCSKAQNDSGCERLGILTHEGFFQLKIDAIFSVVQVQAAPQWIRPSRQEVSRGEAGGEGTGTHTVYQTADRARFCRGQSGPSISSSNALILGPSILLPGIHFAAVPPCMCGPSSFIYRLIIHNKHSCKCLVHQSWKQRNQETPSSMHHRGRAKYSTVYPHYTTCATLENEVNLTCNEAERRITK